MMNKKDELKLVLLRSTNDDFELSMIKSLLKSEDIPYILKGRGSSEYMRVIGGTSIYPTDILVEESSYERAEDIIGSFPGLG